VLRKHMENKQLAISKWQLANPGEAAGHRRAGICADPEGLEGPVPGFADFQFPIANCSLANGSPSSPAWTLQRSTTENGRATQAEPAIHFEDLDIDEDEQFLRTEKRVTVRRSPLPKKTANRVKKAVVLAVVVMLLGVAAWMTKEYGLQSWRFRLESSDNIEISGLQNTARKEVIDVFGDDISRNIFSVALEERKRKLEEIPWVESATVMRLLPNRLAISVHERTPVAFVRMGPKISLIDANGAVMGLPGKASTGKQTHYSFPVIQGIADNEPLSSRAAAMKIYNRMIQELDSDTVAPFGDGGPSAAGITVHHSRDLSEVDLSDPEDVKVTANDAAGTVVIHLGAADFLARYKAYLTHVAEWRQQYPNLQSVDMRYEGQIIVNPDAAKRR
jgi:cell division protein FtsQ